MIPLDILRPPSLLDPSADRYKDWLHLNVFHHESGSIGLINVSLHGAPNDPRSRAIGTALVHVPDVGWFGNLEIHGINEAAIGHASINLERVAMAVNHTSSTLLASVNDPQHALTARLTATTTVMPVIMEQQFPLGHGWISWYVIPRLTVVGEWTVGGERVDLKTASAYHDHNWGRWHWGDDMGWEWGCFITPAPGVAFILSRTSDRAHNYFGAPVLIVQVEGRRRTFEGAAIELSYNGVLQTIMRRVPGAMAALHQDRAQDQLPKTLKIKADDGIDRVEVEFNARAAAQLIVADPLVRGYSFIHQLAGEFTCSGMVGGMEINGAGLGVLEYVY